MNNELLRPISTEEINIYHRDGVVPLRGMFDKDWIELLNKGLNVNCESPTERSRIWDKDDAGHTMFYDTLAWREIEEYKKFIFKSPAAKICGQLMKTKAVHYFFDAVFVRSPGTKFETPWHQDEPYWSIEGYDACTLWMPLVPVKKKNCLSFVPGSHLFKSVFNQKNFGELTGNPKDQVDFSKVADQEFPDINADPESYGVVSWELQPGDCIAFNGRTMHGGSGNLDNDTSLKVFTTKWMGDDVRIKFRNYGMDPDFSSVMIKKGLKSGDRPSTDMYPLVWSKK